MPDPLIPNSPTQAPPDPSGNPLDGKRGDISLNYAMGHLPPHQQGLLRTLVGFLGAPINAPAANRTTANVERALTEYRDGLPVQSQFLDDQIDELHSLNCSMLSIAQREPLLSDVNHACRTMKRHRSWKLLATLDSVELPPGLLAAVGAELALCFLLGTKRFSPALAKDVEILVRRDLKIGIRDLPLALDRNCKNLRRRADRIFVSAKIACHHRSSDPLARTLYWHFHDQQKFARDQAHQGVLDHRCLTVPQVLRAADHLSQAVAGGDPDSARSMLSCVCGLPMSIIDTVPLLHATTADWSAALDLESGLFKLDLSAVAPDRAQPPGDDLTRHASPILVRPLPVALHQLLRHLQLERPDALTAGDIFPPSQNKSRDPIIADDVGKFGIVTSAARLINSLGPFALKQGLTRLDAALATSDFRLIPKSRLYYFFTDREAIWHATRKLYSALDWGDPVRIEQGIGVGSQVVPTRKKVMRWFNWLEEQVALHNPGRRCRLQRLINFHNAYAQAVASIFVLVFALRERSPYPIFANEFRPGQRFPELLDKATGDQPGPDPIALCKVARLQIERWFAHCHAMRRRLEVFGQGDSQFAGRLDQIIAGENVHLLVATDEQLNVDEIGCTNLTGWWPTDLRFVGNFGRHFLQTELPAAGALSRDIDDYVRHHLPGCGRSTSTTDRILREWEGRIVSLLDVVFTSVSIDAITGLARRID